MLYGTDLASNQNVCPKCTHHLRLRARVRLDALLDPEGRFEIGSEVIPMDPLKFKDSKRYVDRLVAANEDTGEADAMVVMQGAIKTVPVVVACFEFEFLGGSMGAVVGERFGAHNGRIARIILVSTALAFLSFSGAVALLT